MSANQEEKKTLLEHVQVRLVAVLAFLVTFAAGTAGSVWQLSLWVYEVKELRMSVDGLKGSVDELKMNVVGRTRDAWLRVGMAKYVAEMKKLNPEMQFPDVWDEMFDPKPVEVKK